MIPKHRRDYTKSRSGVRTYRIGYQYTLAGSGRLMRSESGEKFPGQGYRYLSRSGSRSKHFTLSGTFDQSVSWGW